MTRSQQTPVRGLAALALASLARAALHTPLSRPEYRPGDETTGHICGRDDGYAPRRPQRNHPCPCGSGKKFKKCHGRP